MTTSASTELFLQYIPKADGTPNALGIVKTYAAGTPTPKATYPTFADALAGTNANATTITLGADGVIFFFLAGAYKIDIQDSTGASLPGWPKDNIQGSSLTQSSAELLFADINTPILGGTVTSSLSTGTRTYAITTTPAVTAYTDGMKVLFTPNVSLGLAENAQVNISSIGAVSLSDNTGNVVSGKNLIANANYVITYSSDMLGFVFEQTDSSFNQVNTTENYVTRLFMLTTATFPGMVFFSSGLGINRTPVPSIAADTARWVESVSTDPPGLLLNTQTISTSAIATSGLTIDKMYMIW